jgi:3'-phosphoadenosine 5'-phosphosulfate sulfotransferase (PAPS reductase)/FAD synthetase
MSDRLAGLDPAHAELPRPQALLADAFRVLDEAEAEHQPRKRWALFSGGHDSLAACSVAFAWAKDRGLQMDAAHINTGTGIPQTTAFVEEVCAEQGWPLHLRSARCPYEEIVLEYGFPGPANHGLMYQRLKERCLRQLVREHKQEFNDRIMLVTGVRSEESVRRMRHVERIQREGAQVWAAAIWNWTKLDCNALIKARELPRNPVVDILHMSGECLCGAFAKPGELDTIAEWFPDVAERIRELEAQVAGKGLRAWKWGHRPPRVHREQMSMAFGEGWDVLCAWAKAWLTGAVGSMPSEAELSAMIAALLAEDDLFDVA